jgi:hypothetical protein
VAADLFENLSNVKNLEYFVGDSPEELRKLLLQIRLPVKIYQFYSSGSKHYVWFQTTTPIRKDLEPDPKLIIKKNKGEK